MTSWSVNQQCSQSAAPCDLAAFRSNGLQDAIWPDFCQARKPDAIGLPHSLDLRGGLTDRAQSKCFILRSQYTSAFHFRSGSQICFGSVVLMNSEAQLAEGFAAAVASLNEQFALWVATQKQQKPANLWSQGALDYLRHAVMIRRDSTDKAQASGKATGSVIHCAIIIPIHAHAVVLHALAPMWFRSPSSALELSQIVRANCRAFNQCWSIGQTEALHKLLQIGKQQEPQLSMMPLQHSKVSASQHSSLSDSFS